MTTQTQQIHRRANRTIDIDYYRNRGQTLRREAMANMARGVDLPVLRLVGAAALIVALIAINAHAPASRSAAANATPAAIVVALETR